MRRLNDKLYNFSDEYKAVYKTLSKSEKNQVQTIIRNLMMAYPILCDKEILVLFVNEYATLDVEVAVIQNKIRNMVRLNEQLDFDGDILNYVKF